MSFHHRVLAGSYHPLRLAKAIGKPLGLSSSNHLRVLTYHDIPPQDEPRFAAQLRWLARNWAFVSPDQFAAMASGQEPIRGSNLLLSFDDGFASNRKIAENVLNPMGIRALFFVVSDFIALEDRGQARRFIAEHIQPGTVADQLPDHLHNMSWLDLEALLEHGHGIGAHTRTHARLSRIDEEAELVSEIVSCGDVLERRLGIPVDHFAYTFGDLASFGRKPFAIARGRYRFIYSGLRGDNTGNISPLTLRRDAASAAESTSLLGAFLEGAADLRYAKSRAALDSWV